MATPKTPRGPVPKEALDYFKAKGLKVGFNYTDVWAEEHNASFTVAKIMELDILATTRGIVERSLEDGTTFDKFVKDLAPLLDQSGWSDYGNNRSTRSRLRTIFDTNMRVTRTAGQWRRMERTKDVLPFLLYELGPSVNHRKEHEGWAGIMLPIDDPFWDSAIPPSGYGCACRVRQISKREATGKGGVSARPDMHLVTWKLPDGKTAKAPVGVHPSFAFNPGKHRTSGLDAALKQAEEE